MTGKPLEYENIVIISKSVIFEKTTILLQKKCEKK